MISCVISVSSKHLCMIKQNLSDRIIKLVTLNIQERYIRLSMYHQCILQNNLSIFANAFEKYRKKIVNCKEGFQQKFISFCMRVSFDVLYSF